MDTEHCEKYLPGTMNDIDWKRKKEKRERERERESKDPVLSAWLDKDADIYENNVREIIDLYNTIVSKCEI